MNIVYISYWGVQDGLTAATVLPHLKILADFEFVENIFFCTIERDEKNGTLASPLRKVTHMPLISVKHKNVLVEKLGDFINFPQVLKKHFASRKIDFILCRSALAGALGYRLAKQKGIPYAVESFEPHADYMVESGVWGRFDPRTLIQRRFESQQKRSAAYLLPVSENYTRKLQQEGIAPARIITVPCCVPLEDFLFQQLHRETVRQVMGITPAQRVGIYVGKYGGIYHDEPAFKLYREAFDFFGDDFRIILLTSEPVELVKRKLSDQGVPPEKVFIQWVAHEDVPRYLSAADFAFSTIKPSPSRPYCSPIKNGEYWANGLPILTEDGIGDDTNIIKEEGGGVLLDPNHPAEAFLQLSQMLQPGREVLAPQIRLLAVKHRDMSRVKEAYERMLQDWTPVKILN